MATDPLIRIQYSSKKAGLANSWKKWIGEMQGLDKMNAVEKKEKYEAEFQKWASADPLRMVKYGKILDEYKSVYDSYQTYYLVNSFTGEVFFSGAAALNFPLSFRDLLVMQATNDSKLQGELARLKNLTKSTFKNNNLLTDKKLFVATLRLYSENIDPQWQAESFKSFIKSTKVTLM